MILNSQPSAPAFDSRLGCTCVIQHAGTWKAMNKSILLNLALQLGLGQRCQPEGIAITWQQLFCLRKRRTVVLECNSVPLRLSATPCVSFARLAPRLLFCRTGELGNCRNLLISGDIRPWQAHSQKFAMGEG